MSIAEKMKEKLNFALSPETLEVIDQSDMHAGHAGSRPEGESHFFIKITSAAFEGKTLVQRHRMVNQVISEELANHVHAMALETKAPGE